MKHKDKILQVLRSKNYLQSKNRLCVKRPGNQYAYCIAGILCDIHRKTTKGKWIEAGNLSDITLMSYLGKTHGLPEDVRLYFDVTNNILDLSPNDLTDKQKRGLTDFNLVTLNDNGCTFEELATLIERHG